MLNYFIQCDEWLVLIWELFPIFAYIHISSPCFFCNSIHVPINFTAKKFSQRWSMIIVDFRSERSRLTHQHSETYIWRLRQVLPNYSCIVDELWWFKLIDFETLLLSSDYYHLCKNSSTNTTSYIIVLNNFVLGFVIKIIVSQRSTSIISSKSYFRT